MVDGLKCRVSTKQRLIVLPYDERVRSIIPHTRIIRHNDKHYLLVPHQEVETKLLRNLGYDAPAPIVSNYDWCGATAFDAQTRTAELLTSNRRAYVLSGMGTGKTLAALFAIDYLIRTQRACRALVVAPLSTLTTVWEREVFRFMPHRSVGVLHGTRERRRTVLREDHDIYVINHDGLHTIQHELHNKAGLDIVVIDELAAFRTAMERDLEPVEAKALYLHFVDGLPLAAITDLLQLTNKSGAKACIVSGGRKLKRHFGKWLARQSDGGGLS